MIRILNEKQRQGEFEEGKRDRDRNQKDKKRANHRDNLIKILKAFQRENEKKKENEMGRGRERECVRELEQIVRKRGKSYHRGRQFNKVTKGFHKRKREKDRERE